MKNIKNYEFEELKQELKNIGERPFRAEQIFKWLYQDKVKSFDDMTNISLELREKLKQNYSICNFEIIRKQESSDGTKKYLFDVLDGNAIEEIFKTLNIVGNVEEWFNYGGKPYYFKVILQIFNRSINEETEEKLRALINEYKNERSWLEQIEFYLSSIGKQYIYAATIQQETVTINSKES